MENVVLKGWQKIILLASLSSLTYWFFYLDDAFISLRYAKNLITSGCLCYNPGQFVEGITNIGYSVLLAITRAYLWPKFSIKLFSAIGFITTVLLVKKLFGKTSAIILSLDGFFSMWMNDGMESSIFTALLLWGFYLYKQNKFSLSGIVIGIATWFRLDAIVLWVLMFFKTKNKKLFTISIPFIALELFRWTYYGSLIPHTYFAKPVLYSILLPLNQIPTTLLKKLLLIVGAYWYILMQNIKQKNYWGLFPLSLFLIYSKTPVGGIRYLSYGIPFLFVNIKKVPKIFWITLIGTSVFLHLWVYPQKYTTDNFEEIAINLSKYSPKTVALADAGILGFYQQGKVIDILGLSYPQATKLLRNQDWEGLCKLVENQEIVFLSSDTVSKEMKKCISCTKIESQKYAPLIYKNATLDIYVCNSTNG